MRGIMGILQEREWLVGNEGATGDRGVNWEERREGLLFDGEFPIEDR